MAAGGLALLAALFVMWRSIHSGSSTEHSTHTEDTATPSGAAPAPGSPAARPSKQRVNVGGVPLPRPRTDEPDEAPSVSAIEEHAPPTSMLNKTHLEYGGTQLRTQAKAVEPLVRECVDKANATGAKPTGSAMLTYVVAKHGDKYEVEDTSYDAEQTTLQQDSLITCLSETAKAMKFVGLPREAEALVVTRSVKVENGALTEYKHVGFSYLR